jgi:hypothetical protein
MKDNCKIIGTRGIDAGAIFAAINSVVKIKDVYIKDC